MASYKYMLYYKSQSFFINFKGQRPYLTCHEKRPMQVSLKHPPTHPVKCPSEEIEILNTIKFLKAAVSDIVYFVFTDECSLFTTGTRDYIALVRSCHFAPNKTSKDFTESHTNIHWTMSMALPQVHFKTFFYNNECFTFSPLHSL